MRTLDTAKSFQPDNTGAVTERQPESSHPTLSDRALEFDGPQRQYLSNFTRSREANSESHFPSAHSSAENLTGKIIAISPAMRELLSRALKAADCTAPILIQGETGCGKECIAQMLHHHSALSAKPFVARNCAAIPATLFESDMFGHMKGSFTGADRDRKGAFIEADGGTLFLDEIGDLEYGLQTKLLRAIQERVIRPVGSERDLVANPRIICATNKDLRESCKNRAFREDLYYRLATVLLQIPPLRERREDIIPLARYFAGQASDWKRNLSDAAEQRLLTYSWPGNARELRSIIQQAMIFASESQIQAEDLNIPGKPQPGNANSDLLSDVERCHILRILEKCKGNRSAAARLLGLARSTLILKLKSYHAACGSVLSGT